MGRFAGRGTRVWAVLSDVRGAKGEECCHLLWDVNLPRKSGQIYA